MIRRPPRSTLDRSSAASDVYKRQAENVLAAPGVFPFTRGLNAAQYQFMPWANQPVIGYGLPEETRRRMDYLQAQGMTGYFGNTFYNLSLIHISEPTRPY